MLPSFCLGDVDGLFYVHIASEVLGFLLVLRDPDDWTLLKFTGVLPRAHSQHLPSLKCDWQILFDERCHSLSHLVSLTVTVSLTSNSTWRFEGITFQKQIYVENRSVSLSFSDLDRKIRKGPTEPCPAIHFSKCACWHFVSSGFVAFGTNYICERLIYTCVCPCQNILQLSAICILRRFTQPDHIPYVHLSLKSFFDVFPHLEAMTELKTSKTLILIHMHAVKNINSEIHPFPQNSIMD